MYLVTLTRSGPEWNPTKPAEQQARWSEHASYMDNLVAQGIVVLGGPLGDEHRVVLAVDADDAATVRAIVALDPWSDSHLQLDAVEDWTIRLDAHRRSGSKGAS